LPKNGAVILEAFAMMRKRAWKMLKQPQPAPQRICGAPPTSHRACAGSAKPATFAGDAATAAQNPCGGGVLNGLDLLLPASPASLGLARLGRKRTRPACFGPSIRSRAFSMNPLNNELAKGGDARRTLMSAAWTGLMPPQCAGWCAMGWRPKSRVCRERFIRCAGAMAQDKLDMYDHSMVYLGKIIQEKDGPRRRSSK